MNEFEKQLARFKRLDLFARTHRKGEAEDFADILDVSRSQFYRILKDMQAMDLPIAYNRKEKFLYYEEEVEFIFEIKRKPPNTDNPTR